MQPAIQRQILVVDGDRDVRETVLAMLSITDDFVMAIEPSLDVIDILGRTRFDVLVTDLSIEGLDGAEFLRRVRDTAPHCRVVVMTGGSPATSDGAFAAACDGGNAPAILTKPFRRHELLAAVG